MNDLRTFLLLLTKNNIEYSYDNNITEFGKDYQTVVLESHTKNVEGYFGFECTFYFNNEGKLEKVSVYE